MREKNYWQVATGSSGRDYTELCLKFGVAFVGKDEDRRRMEEELRVGDFVILKHGMKKIGAVGKVVEIDNQHMEVKTDWLQDLDGWHAEGCCYVDWKKPNEDQSLTINGLTRSSFQKTFKPEIIKAAEKIWETGKRSKIRSESPPKPEPVSDDKLRNLITKNELIHENLIDNFMKSFSHFQGLANSYHKKQWSGEIREHEARSFLIIPFLLALGWKEEQLKIELPLARRKRVDIACYNGEYQGSSKRDNCVAIIETKAFKSGLDYVYKQAFSYSEHFPNNKAVIVSNGYCFKVYEANNQEKPCAYLNLIKPTERYPLDCEVGGALDAIKWLSPKNFAR